MSGQREVFLLRVTGRCRNAFEWCLRVHYFADEPGVTESQLRASVFGTADDACWETGDRVLVRLDGPDWQAAQAFARSAGVNRSIIRNASR